MIATAHLFDKSFTIIDPASLHLQYERSVCNGKSIRLIEIARHHSLSNFEGNLKKFSKKRKNFIQPNGWESVISQRGLERKIEFLVSLQR